METKQPDLGFIAHIQKNLQDLRINKEHCDFTILIGEDEFHVHKVLLAASSNYFRAMLSHNSKESQQNKVSMLEISSDGMKALIDFIYTSTIHIDNDNVQEILVAANIIQLDRVQELCIQHIKDNIDISNCLGVLVVADKCNLSELSESALSFCLDSYEQIVKESEFLDIDEECLVKLISNNQLNVSSEEKVFESILRWIDAHPKERKTKIDVLMPHVRLSLVEPVPLVAISNHEYVKSSSECRDLVSQAKDFKLLEKYPREQAQLKEFRFKPRMSKRRRRGIYSVGGWTNEFKPIAFVERYDPHTDSWDEVQKMFSARMGVGVAILDTYLYAIGGHDGQAYLKSAERFDILTEVWYDDVPDMKYDRTSLGVVALDGYIYAIGGQDSNGPVNVVERYDPRTNEWQSCPPMHTRRFGPGVTVLNGEIIVVGGQNEDQVLCDAESYRPGDKEWRRMESQMKETRKHLGCTTYDGKIYVVGGRGDSNELSTAECFSNCEWKYIPSMSLKRSGIGLVELDGLLYAIGGHDGDVRLKQVEAFDPKTGTWSLKGPMIYERLGGGMAVYNPPPHL